MKSRTRRPDVNLYWRHSSLRPRGSPGLGLAPRRQGTVMIAVVVMIAAEAMKPNVPAVPNPKSPPEAAVPPAAVLPATAPPAAAPPTPTATAPAPAAAPWPTTGAAQIGRASCRGRV